MMHVSVILFSPKLNVNENDNHTLTLIEKQTD